MKLSSCLLAAALVLPAAAAPTAYNMTFTGGFYLNLDNPPTPFAPDSASFTYDPNSGFSNFLVGYDGETFNLTASANAPLICNASGLNCSTGNAASAFTAFGENPTWLSYEGYSGSSIVTYLVLSPYEGSNLGPVSVSAPGFPGFLPGQSDLVRSGAFTFTAGSAPGPTPTPTPTPGSTVPEPGVAQMLAVAGLGLLCFRSRRGRERLKSAVR